MSTNNHDLQAALNKKLNTLSVSIDKDWENTTYAPTIGTPYIRSWLIPGETMPLTLGTQGYEEYGGIFQIDVCYPIEQGWGTAKTTVDSICTLFRRGTSVTYNNLSVKIWRSYPAPAILDGEWYRIPINVIYTTYATA